MKPVDIPWTDISFIRIYKYSIYVWSYTYMYLDAVLANNETKSLSLVSVSLNRAILHEEADKYITGCSEQRCLILFNCARFCESSQTTSRFPFPNSRWLNVILTLRWARGTKLSRNKHVSPLLSILNQLESFWYSLNQRLKNQLELFFFFSTLVSFSQAP